MDKEYRIEEYAGAFTIQIKIKETTGVLWWKKNTPVWKKVDTYGCQFCVWGYQFPLQSFRTLDEAKIKVSEFKKGVGYHEV